MFGIWNIMYHTKRRIGFKNQNFNKKIKGAIHEEAKKF